MSNPQAPFGLGRIGATLRTSLQKWFDTAGGVPQNALLVAPRLEWLVSSAPAAATQATVTRARVNPGVTVPVVTSICATLIIPPAVNQPAITLDLVGSISGALWSYRFGVGAAVAGGLVQTFALSGIAWTSLNTDEDITLQFSAAGAATTLQSVSMSGYDVSIT